MVGQMLCAAFSLLPLSGGWLTGRTIARVAITCGGSRSFWHKLRYGSRGTPENALPCPESVGTILDLKKVFDQWNVDKSGTLDSEEMLRGLLAAGIDEGHFGTAPGERITFAEFEASLTPEQRTKIEAKLNEDGVMRSLYVPPEKWVDRKSDKDSRWERKVQYEAQRDGNKQRQNDILGDELGKG